MNVLNRALGMCAEVKVIRRVRTPAGARRYKQPIGSIIVRKGRLMNLFAKDPIWDGWDLVEDRKGRQYDVGRDDDGKYIATPHGVWEPIVTGRSLEEVYEALDEHVGAEKRSKPLPKSKSGSITRKEAAQRMIEAVDTEFPEDDDRNEPHWEFLDEFSTAVNRGRMTPAEAAEKIRERARKLRSRKARDSYNRIADVLDEAQSGMTPDVASKARTAKAKKDSEDVDDSLPEHLRGKKLTAAQKRVLNLNGALAGRVGYLQSPKNIRDFNRLMRFQNEQDQEYIQERATDLFVNGGMTEARAWSTAIAELEQRDISKGEQSEVRIPKVDLEALRERARRSNSPTLHSMLKEPEDVGTAPRPKRIPDRRRKGGSTAQSQAEREDDFNDRVDKLKKYRFFDSEDYDKFISDNVMEAIYAVGRDEWDIAEEHLGVAEAAAARNARLEAEPIHPVRRYLTRTTEGRGAWSSWERAASGGRPLDVQIAGARIRTQLDKEPELRRIFDREFERIINERERRENEGRVPSPSTSTESNSPVSPRELERMRADSNQMPAGMARTRWNMMVANIALGDIDAARQNWEDLDTALAQDGFRVGEGPRALAQNTFMKAKRARDREEYARRGTVGQQNTELDRPARPPALTGLVNATEMAQMRAATDRMPNERTKRVWSQMLDAIEKGDRDEAVRQYDFVDQNLSKEGLGLSEGARGYAEMAIRLALRGRAVTPEQIQQRSTFFNLANRDRQRVRQLANEFIAQGHEESSSWQRALSRFSREKSEQIAIDDARDRLNLESEFIDYADLNPGRRIAYGTTRDGRPTLHTVTNVRRDGRHTYVELDDGTTFSMANGARVQVFWKPGRGPLNMAPGDGQRVDLTPAARRQEEIDAVRPVAQVFAEVDEFVDNMNADHGTVLLQIDQMRNTLPGNSPQRRALDAIREEVGKRTGWTRSDRDAVLDEIGERVRTLGLRRVEKPGERTQYDPERHRLFVDDGSVQPGDEVEIVRPGYSARLSDGETVQVDLAYVGAIGGHAAMATTPFREATDIVRQRELTDKIRARKKLTSEETTFMIRRDPSLVLTHAAQALPRDRNIRRILQQMASEIQPTQDSLHNAVRRLKFTARTVLGAESRLLNAIAQQIEKALDEEKSLEDFIEYKQSPWRDGDGVHRGAMIALLPREEDARRLAVKDGEPVEELHVTLRNLGDAANITPLERANLVAITKTIAEQTPMMTLNAFALNMFNPNSSSACIVLGVGGKGIAELQEAVCKAADSCKKDLPPNHTPYVPHITLKYTRNMNEMRKLKNRTGPVTFDRMRVVFAGEAYDFPLTGTALETEPEIKARRKRGLPKTQKCNWCADQATKRVIWAEGRAYIPSCEGCLDRTKRHIERQGDDVVAIRSIPQVKSRAVDLVYGRL